MQVIFCSFQLKNNKNFPQIRLLRSLNLMQKTDKTRISTNTSTDCHDIVKIGVISVLKEASIGHIISTDLTDLSNSDTAAQRRRR